jgi:hypothetical protein
VVPLQRLPRVAGGDVGNLLGVRTHGHDPSAAKCRRV